MLKKFVDGLDISEADHDPVSNERVPTVETKLTTLRKVDQVGQKVVEHFAFLLKGNGGNFVVKLGR